MVRFIKSILTIVIGTIVVLPIVLVVLMANGMITNPAGQGSFSSIPTTLTSAFGLRPGMPPVIGHWPPVKGKEFPDLTLSDQNGEPVSLRDFAGKLVFVEYAAVPCEGCQAFAGGKKCGAFGGFPVQRGLESIEHYAAQYAGVELGSDDVVFVQILLYGKDVTAPSQDEVTAWANHFEMEREQNQIVLRGSGSMLGKEAFDLIPGFQLIDRDFIVRGDSCGHHPVDNLYTDLLPLLGRLARD